MRTVTRDVRPNARLISTKCHILVVSAMVARGVRNRALRSTPSSDRLYSALIRYDPDDDWVRCGPPRLVQADAHWSWCWLRI
jgi:hypothetical protein